MRAPVTCRSKYTLTCMHPCTCMSKYALTCMQPCTCRLRTWPANTPRADTQDGLALVKAAEGGHVEIVRLVRFWTNSVFWGLLVSRWTTTDGDRSSPVL